MRLRTNITDEEVTCSCGCGIFIMSEPILDVVQDTREHFNKPVVIHSAYRCEEHNENIGGKKHSQHLAGRAIDFHIEGIGINELYNYINLKYPNCLGLGKYKSFVHVDDRMSRAFRWDLS